MSIVFDSATYHLKICPTDMLTHEWDDIRTRICTADKRMEKMKALRMLEPWNSYINYGAICKSESYATVRKANELVKICCQVKRARCRTAFWYV